MDTSLEKYIEQKRAEYTNAVGVGTIKINNGLDLTNCKTQYEIFRTKSQASAFAQSRGYNASDAKRFRSRFASGWVVGECLDGTTYRILTKESYADVPLIV